MAPTIPFLPLMGSAAGAAVLVSKYSTISTAMAMLWSLSTAFAFYAFYSGYIYPIYLSPLRKVPTVPGFPLWGQFFTIITAEVGVPQREWHQRYGPIIRYFFPFGAERLSVADDDAIKQMTIRNPYNYPKPVRAKLWMERILGEGVLLAEGPTHVHQRKALAPSFSIGSIRSLMPIFWQKSLHMANLWQQELAADGVSTKSFEALEWLNRATLDIIGEAGLGTEINSLDDAETPLRQAYRGVFSFDIQSRLIHGLTSFLPLMKYFPSQTNRDMLHSREIILNKAANIIKEKHLLAKQQGARQKDIISLIVKDNMNAEAADTLSFEAMRDQVMTFLGAGHDTTATSAAWTLLMLAKNPQVQDRLRNEIRQHFPFLFDPSTRLDGTRLNNTEVDQLPYLDSVCRESLRYIPSIPMTVRQSVADDRLGEYFVPAGTTSYILANTINRLPQYWGSTADEFNPDRWDDLPSTYTTNAFMTFLQGPRGCIGRKFAEVEMKMLLCSLLSMFMFERDMSQADPEDWKMWRLVLRPKDGVKLMVTPLA